MSEQTEQRSVAETTPETEPSYLVDIQRTSDGITEVTMRFSESFIGAVTADRPGFDPADDDLAEVNADDLEAWGDDDRTEGYHTTMAEFMRSADTLKEQADQLATALSTLEMGLSFPQEARDVLPPLREFLARAAEGTPAAYASLPPETKRLVEYIDRLNQMVHLFIGSTYNSPIDALYSPAETADAIEDFFAGAEAGLSSALSGDGSTYHIHIERPPHPDLINASSNLMYDAVTALGADPLSTINSALKQALSTYVKAYRGA